MRDSRTRPTMTWVPVRDANGRVRMEARWAVAAVKKSTSKAA